MIHLRPIKQWVEKEEGIPEGTIRFYINGLWVGSATPVRTEPYELFEYESFYPNIVHNISEYKAKPLQEISDSIELYLKEFIARIAFCKPDTKQDGK